MLEALEAVIETNDKYESGRGDILTIETCIYILDNECVTELLPENIMTASSAVVSEQRVSSLGLDGDEITITFLHTFLMINE